MTHISTRCGDFLLDVYGGGVAVALTRKANPQHLYWQGDEAADIMQRLGDNYTQQAFAGLWDDYGAEQ